MPSDSSDSLTDYIEQLEKLGKMKLQGLLTDEEFQKLKQQLLNNFENKNPRILRYMASYTGNLSMYENAGYGIRINYPSDWEGTELNRSSGAITSIIEFGFPVEKPSNSYGRYAGVVYIYVRKLYARNISIQTFSAGEIFRLRRRFKDFEIIESLSSESARMPAHRIIFSYSWPNAPFKIVNMRIWVITSEKAYCIVYHTRLDWFHDILPVVNRMIDSFELIQSSYQPIKQPEMRDLLVYDNPELGIRTKYLVNWITEERYNSADKDSSKIVAFMSPSEINAELFEDIIIVEITDVQPADAILDSYVDTHIGKLIKKTFRTSKFTLLESRTIYSISANPGKKVVYKVVASPGQEIKTIEVFFINNNKAYSITYAAKSSEFDKYLSETNQMIDSFEIAS